MRRLFSVLIEALRFEAILGILPSERKTPQPIVVDIAFDYEYDNDFIDYAQVATLVRSLIETKRYLLVEDALEEIEATIRKKYPSITKLSIKIAKPSVLPDCRVAVALKS